MGAITKNISSALFGKTRRAILELIFSNIDKRHYMRQISKLTGSGMGGVQRELESLVEAGILLREREGRQVYFHANPSCPVFDELKSLVIKTGGMTDSIKAALLPIANRISIAFIYGSMARMDGSTGSDIDLMVVGEASFEEVVNSTAGTQNIIGREINPSVYSEKEFRDRVISGNNFLKQVVEGPKIYLIGDDNELERLVK